MTGICSDWEPAGLRRARLVEGLSWALVAGVDSPSGQRPTMIRSGFIIDAT